MNPVHYSSKTDEWATPQATFDALSAEFGPFDLDPCATAENAKAPTYYTRDDDGLTKPWFGRVFVNPPYGRGIGKWVERASWVAMPDEYGDAPADLVVCLLPARTDTKWWHDYVIPCASEIRFLRGRLKFGGAKNSAPFPSAVVVFRRAP